MTSAVESTDSQESSSVNSSQVRLFTHSIYTSSTVHRNREAVRTPGPQRAPPTFLQQLDHRMEFTMSPCLDSLGLSWTPTQREGTTHGHLHPCTKSEAPSETLRHRLAESPRSKLGFDSYRRSTRLGLLRLVHVLLRWTLLLIWLHWIVLRLEIVVVVVVGGRVERRGWSGAMTEAGVKRRCIEWVRLLL